MEERSDLEGALDGVEANDAADVGEDGFDAGILAVAAAFEHAHARAGAADAPCDIPEQTGVILGLNQQFHGERCRIFGAILMMKPSDALPLGH